MGVTVMRSHTRLILAALFALAPQASFAKDPIKQQMIQESINQYSGRCPCPYNVMKNGRSCGGRSAYSRPGGQSPLCYESDITEDMKKRWKR
jgi:hypothetical protein